MVTINDRELGPCAACLLIAVNRPAVVEERVSPHGWTPLCMEHADGETAAQVERAADIIRVASARPALDALRT